MLFFFKRVKSIFAVLVFLCVFITPVFADHISADCQATSVKLRGEFGVVDFTVEVADTDESRSNGLMHRRSIPQFSGMLFIYDTPRRVSFWMRNTLISLDMLFFDEHGVLQKIHPRAVPLDETPIFGGEAIQYILDKRRMAESLGIETEMVPPICESLGLVIETERPHFGNACAPYM